MTAHVILTVVKPLTPEQRKSWYVCVRDHVPSGVLNATSLIKSDQTVSSSYYKVKSAKGHDQYVIPLVRDLLTHEVHDILEAWCKIYPHDDFILDWSQPGHQEVTKASEISAHKLREVLDSWAKQQHVTWYQDLTDKGWRLGPTMSTKQKTHPWLQPWESLPVQAKMKNTQAVKDLLALFKEQGYKIVQIPEA